MLVLIQAEVSIGPQSDEDTGDGLPSLIDPRHIDFCSDLVLVPKAQALQSWKKTKMGMQQV